MKRIAALPPAGVRRGLYGAAAAALAMATAQPVMAQASGPVRMFDIPAQDASTALLTLCMEADCDLAFARRPGHVVRTRPVHGRMSWRAALAQMLDGADLGYRFVGARGVRVWAAARPRVQPDAAPSAPPEATVLAPVEVIGRLSHQIDESLRRKRESDVISDSLSSERIGELPAANLAEALQRVPGVAIEREVGEGQFVSVRGLGPLFQSVTLNGAPVAFNENIRNSTQSGRQFRFRALSVDLLAGARLTKSSSADMVDGGIGSNIDIETAGGLDGDAFLTARLGGEVEARTGRFSPDVSLAGRIVSADGNRGLIAGLSQEQRAVRYDRFQIMRYSQLDAGGERLAVPNDVRTTIETEDRRRRSGFVGADWRVSPGFGLDFDALISTFDNAIREDRLVYSLGERLAAPGAILSVEDGVVAAGRVVDGRIDNNTEFSDQDHLNVATSLGADIRAGDWRLTPRLSLSRAHSVLDTPLERFSSQSPEGVAYDFDVADAATTRRAARMTTDFDLLDPSSLTLAQLNVRAVESRDDDTTLLIAARRGIDRGWRDLRLSALSLGAQYSDRGRDYQRRDRRASLRVDPFDPGGVYAGATPHGAFSDLVDTQATPWSTTDFDRIRSAFLIPGEHEDVVFRPGDLAPTGSDLQNSYSVGERVTAAYARLDYDGQALGRPIFGNAGLRLVWTRTHVEGARMEDDGGVARVLPLAHDGEYSTLLPSLNLAVDLTDDAMLRFAASRTMTRPSLADLRASTVPASVLTSAIYKYGQAAVDDPEPGVIFSGVGGNPALTPYLSTNLDLSYEFTRRSTSFSIALFHKRIDDFIQAVTAEERLTFETQSGEAVQADVLISRPRNIGRAQVDGVELGFHRRIAKGLGLWANATWTDSHRADGGRLTGVSDLAWSISPYLERGPLALNLSWSWRSDFQSEADMQGGGVSDFIVGSAGYLDAQASYRLNAGVRLSMAATNLTDTRDLAYEGVESRLLQLGSVGRQLSMSLEVAW